MHFVTRLFDRAPRTQMVFIANFDFSRVLRLSLQTLPPLPPASLSLSLSPSLPPSLPPTSHFPLPPLFHPLSAPHLFSLHCHIIISFLFAILFSVSGRGFLLLHLGVEALSPMGYGSELVDGRFRNNQSVNQSINQSIWQSI